MSRGGRKQRIDGFIATDSNTTAPKIKHFTDSCGRIVHTITYNSGYAVFTTGPFLGEYRDSSTMPTTRSSAATISTIATDGKRKRDHDTDFENALGESRARPVRKVAASGVVAGE